MMYHRLLAPAVFSLVLSAMLSCSTGPGDDAAGRDAASKLSAQRFDPPADLRPPPGIDADQVTPRKGEALTRARMSLAQIAETLPPPDYLAQTPATPIEVKPIPLAAQRAYARARQVWRDGSPFEAVRHLLEADGLAPNQPRILKLLGLIYTTSGNKVRGAVYLQRAIAIDPSDAEVLFLLGRHELEQRKVPPAITVLARAMNTVATDQDADPALGPMISYFLAVALQQEGYASEAIAQYTRYLHADRADIRMTWRGRELALIDQARPLTWRSIGDLHLQLDQPRKASEAYAAVINEADGTADLDLIKRIVYTDLRLGDAAAAQTATITTVRESDSSDEALTLVRYLFGYLPSDRLAGQLRAVYAEEGRPESLALALAELLPTDQAIAVLSEHIEHSPGDSAVLEKLMRLLMPAGSADTTVRRKAVARAIGMTRDLAVRVPDQAEQYADALFEAVGDPRAVVDAEGQLGESLRQDAFVLTLLGRAHRLVGDLDTASATLDRAMRTAPRMAMPRVEQARVLMSRGSFDEAANLLEGVDDPGNTDLLLLRVRLLVRADRRPAALTLLDDAIAQQPGETTLVIVKAQVLFEEGRNDEGERLLLDTLNTQPAEEALYAALLAHYNRRLAQNDREVEQRRAALLRRLLTTIPNSRLGRLTRARLLIEAEEYDKARVILDGLLAENDRDFDAMRAMFDLYNQSGRKDEAVAILERMLLQQPETFERARDLAVLYAGSDRLPQAIQMLKQALQREDVEQPVTLAMVLVEWVMKLNPANFAEADQILTEAINRFPEHASDLRYHQATLASQRGDQERFEQLMLLNLEEDPDHDRSNNALGYQWAVEGRNLDRAKEMIERALKVDPDSAAYLDSMGWVLYKMGDFDGAVRRLSDARDAPDGEYPVILDHLGDALYRVGREAEAAQQWEAASVLLRNNRAEYTSDPEIEGLLDRVKSKIEAATRKEPVSIAPLPDEAR